MATAAPPERPSTAVEPLSPMAGLLSYFVPGLGQILQGRVGKGILFLMCIYTLFFYGMYLGTGSVTIQGRTYRLNSNVYLPDTAEVEVKGTVNRLVTNLYNRPQFAGQFWVGVAAWPAIWQYMHFDRDASQEIEHQLYALYSRAEQEAKDGDEQAATHTRQEAEQLEQSNRHRHPLLGDFQREPSAAAINAVQNAGDKRLELGWVYTVIAGVLNIMVIYDAVAGPAFRAGRSSEGDKDKKVE
jgi:hypothetical protein